MWEFESSFPFRETQDQLRAIAQTKADMESTRPMDRLICGAWASEKRKLPSAPPSNA